MLTKTWLRYFSKRFYPQLSLLVILGVSLSSVVLEKGLFHPFPFIISFLTLTYAAFYLRLADDVQDCDHDKIAFPERVLFEGAQQILFYLQIGMIPLFAVIFILFSGARVALVLTSGYLWLLMHDFYASKWMKKHLFTNELAKQGMIFFLTLLVVSIGRPEIAFNTPGLAYALMVFSSSVIYHISKQLDPYSHPVSLTYVHYYGFRTTYWLVCAFLVVAAVCAYILQLSSWLWPFEILVAWMLTMLFKHPKRFQLAHISSVLSLMAHAWAGVWSVG